MHIMDEVNIIAYNDHTDPTHNPVHRIFIQGSIRRNRFDATSLPFPGCVYPGCVLPDSIKMGVTKTRQEVYFWDIFCQNRCFSALKSTFYECNISAVTDPILMKLKMQIPGNREHLSTHV